MPIDNSIVHQIHKKPDGQPASLTLREAELASSQALEQLLATYYDPYEIARLLYTVNREIAVRDAEPDTAQEDTGQTQTMMAVFARPKDPRFGGKARTRSVKPEGFTGALPYSLWLQDGAAPLMFVLPGLGGSRQGTRALAVAELAYKEGYHVACFSNNFNWEFIRHAPAGYLPGYTPRDINLIQKTYQAVEEELTARHGKARQGEWRCPQERASSVLGNNFHYFYTTRMP